MADEACGVSECVVWAFNRVTLHYARTIAIEVFIRHNTSQTLRSCHSNSPRQMPELSFAVGEEDVLVLEAEAGFPNTSGTIQMTIE